MKRIIFLVVASAIFFSYCNKNVVNTQSTTQPPPPPPPPPPINYLIANAGSDTTICMLYDGTGVIFKGMLDGRASRDDSGKIVSYSWSEITGPNSVLFPPNTKNLLYLDNLDSVGFSKDSAQVTLLLRGSESNGGALGEIGRLFMLTIRDDHGRVDSARVTINIIQNFDEEYDGLSWDSTAGLLTTISVKAKPGLIKYWPNNFDYNNGYSGIYLSSFNGQCFDTTNQTILPYVPYDSIQLTDKSLFYSEISIPQTIINPGTLFQGISAGIMYPEIYAKTNSGIDFSQKVSIGFIEGLPPDSYWKILPKKLTRQMRVNRQ
jgi:hypothetical protein